MRLQKVLSFRELHLVSVFAIVRVIAVGGESQVRARISLRAILIPLIGLLTMPRFAVTMRFHGF